MRGLKEGNISSFYGSSCANNGKDALNTPDRAEGSTLTHTHARARAHPTPASAPSWIFRRPGPHRCVCAAAAHPHTQTAHAYSQTARPYTCTPGPYAQSSDPHPHTSDPNTRTPIRKTFYMHNHTSDPHTHISYPNTRTPDPHTHISYPNTRTSDPHTHISYPNTRTSDPHTHISYPNTHTSDPHTHISYPNTHTSDPHTHISYPHTRTSDPRTHNATHNASRWCRAQRLAFRDLRAPRTRFCLGGSKESIATCHRNRIDSRYSNASTSHGYQPTTETNPDLDEETLGFLCIRKYLCTMLLGC
eukprot:1196319-Prorocentrum_minimum.AAC.1